MTTLLEVLTRRGSVQDATPGLADRLARGPITGYVGFDPTSDSLHVGNLIPVQGLAWLQRTGGMPLAVVGGGTGMVGDPSGKRAERPILSRDDIDRNVDGLRRQLARFLDFEGANAARMLNNADWLRGLPLMDFLRDTGKHFTLGYMLQKESVRSRMDVGISFTEFSYMLVQAYDFAHLYRTTGCELQMGGSDQWGNITAGIELVHRADQATVHGLVFPLLTTATGAKFGKSEGDNIWLDPARTSPYQFYQFWLNADDRDVERYLRFFTFLPLDTIEEISAVHAGNPAERHGQRILAQDVTTRVHGEDTARRVMHASALLFGSEDLKAADEGVFEVLAGELPVTDMAGDALGDGVLLVDALLSAGLASSKGDARRVLQGNGYAVNGARESNAERRLTADDLLAGGYVLLQKGKKNYALLRAH